MKHLAYLIIIIAIIGCNDKTKSLNKPRAEGYKISKYDKLLAKFKNVSFDTLKVYSLEEDNFNDYKGRALDSLDAILFPKEIAEANFIEPPGIFACFKFDIDSSRIGLIARTPSEYLPSSVKLFVFDKKLDKITEYIELAESFGDAGDALTKTSWLIRNKENKIQSLIWVEESHDNSVDDENDTIVESWDYHYLIDFSKPKLDTINKNSKMLVEKYKNIISEKASR